MFQRLNRPILALLALITVASAAQVQAARDLSIPAQREMEILVMEVPGCKYCPLFREHVLPAYTASPRARDMPIRFVDVSAADTSKLKLTSPIETVPTAVLMRNNKEIGRIEGYVGPSDFGRLISAILGRP